MDVRDLDREVRVALRGLDPRNATSVAEHLVAAGTLLHEDPAAALAHARAARERASRIAAVREAVGVAAYHAGDYAEAARELKAFRRMSGERGYPAVLADCERALGRPEAALRAIREALADAPTPEESIELRLVEAGARADLGELAAARLVLEAALGGRPRVTGIDLSAEGTRRLAVAYADLLEATGDAGAAEWRIAVAAADDEDDDGGVYFFDDTDDTDDDGDADGSSSDHGAAGPVVASGDSGGDDRAGTVIEAVEQPRDDDPAPVAAPGVPDDAALALLDLPGTSDAELEAEVAELLGEDVAGPDEDPESAGGDSPA